MTTALFEPATPGPHRVATRSVVRWSGVFSGAVIAIGLMFLLTSLWRALAFSSDIAWFADTIEWWNAATAIVVLLVGGLLAGWLSGVRGWGPGLLNGLTTWGLLITGTVVFGVGSAVATSTLAQAGGEIAGPDSGQLWPVFVAYSIGIVAAVVGGMIGGALPRPAAMFRHLGQDPSDGIVDIDLDRFERLETARRMEGTTDARSLADRDLTGR